MVYYEQIGMTGGFVIQRGSGFSGEHDTHIHDVLEIGVILSGKVRYQFGPASYEGAEGDIFICRPFTPHWGYNVEGESPCEWILILFTPAVVSRLPGGTQLLAPFYMMEDSVPIIWNQSIYAQRIRQAAETALQADQSGSSNPIGEAEKYLALMDMLMQVYRHYADKQLMPEGPVASRSMLHIVTHLLDHALQSVDIEQLIRQSGWGKTLFYREFKRLTGLTPNQFIHRVRLQAAVELLIATQKSITEIAYECGYESLTTFHNRFREQYGKAPGNVRSERRIPL